MTGNIRPLITLVLFLLPIRASCQDIYRLGGDLSTSLPGRNALQLPAPNVTDADRRALMIAGFAVFHRQLTKTDGLGTAYVNNSCGGCHVQNGRGPAKFSKSVRGNSQMVIKLSLPDLNSDGTVKVLDGFVDQVQDHSISGRNPFSVSLQWIAVPGKYPDGTKYELRRPDLKVSISGIKRQKLLHSLRMSPALIGESLLDAVPQEEIEALSDPNDSNSDGISGHPNYVIDHISGGYKIGRFGFKASQSSLLQQTSAALFGDMGISNFIFAKNGESSEIKEADLNQLMIYQKLAGVPFARDQEKPTVIAGKALFQTIGCDGCHRITLKTGDVEDSELANQEIHPFTDLLLHDMGPDLSDKRPEFSATGSEWRTTPLWGLGFSYTISSVKPVFLHDGRARTIEEAILWHGGEGKAARERFKHLKKEDRRSLIDFLRSL